MVWTLGLIMLLGTVLMVGARYRSRSEFSLANHEQAAADAESAINLAIMIALAPRGTAVPEFPLSCTMPDGAHARITVTAEIGKLDLNAGSARSLTALFSRLANDSATGERIAAGIVTARDPRLAENARSENVQIGFKSILELDRIPGITPDLLRAALPMLTVRSGRVEPDPATAPAILRDLLALPADGVPNTAVSDITIRADVTSGKNGRFVRDALVSLRPDSATLFAIREWRRADVPAGSLPSVAPTSNCLDALQAGG